MLASTEFDSRKLLTLICLVVTVAERGQKYDPLSVVITAYVVQHWLGTRFTKCSAIAEEPRCRVRWSFGQKWKNGT